MAAHVLRSTSLTRRQAIAALGSVGGALLSSRAAGAQEALSFETKADLGKPPHEFSVHEALAAMAQRRISPREYVDELLNWQSRWTALNAYISQDLVALRCAAERADNLQRDRHLLAGLPIAIKDNIDVRGMVTTAGTPALREYRPATTAPLVQSLLDQGAMVMGKAGLHELAAGGTCANLTFGQIRNPYDLEAIPGGSSGGTAAAVAARLVPAGLGTDTGGSCRLPAALCGCVGFRPSSGRYDSRGVVPRAARRDTIGWMARSVADVRLLDSFSNTQAVEARPLVLKGLRLGVPREYYYAELDETVERIVETALTQLRDAGVVLIEADIPQLGHLRREAAHSTWAGFLLDLDRYLRDSGAAVSIAELVQGVADPQLRRSMQEGLSNFDAAAQKPESGLRTAEEALQAAYNDYFTRHRLEALIIPTSPIPAPPVPEDPAAGGTGPAVMVRNTGPSAQAGLPGLSLPAGLTGQGLPVGVEIDGPAGTDASLLRIGRLLESVMAPLPPPPPPA